MCVHTTHMLGWHELYIATQRCAGACSNKIMDPEVPHALRLQGILVGERPAKQSLHVACLTLFALCCVWLSPFWHA